MRVPAKGLVKVPAKGFVRVPAMGLVKLPALGIAAAAALLAALACASSAPPPEGSPETETGRTLYGAKCHGCHRLYPPNRVAPEKWPALMEKMAVKAKLTPEEQQAILAYLLSAAPAK